MNDNDERSGGQKYLDALINRTPGTSSLKKNSGMDIDLSKLTVAGHGLAFLTIVFAASAVLLGAFYWSTSQDTRVTAAWTARALGIPIAIIIGSGVFFVGKSILSLMGIRIVRDDHETGGEH